MSGSLALVLNQNYEPLNVCNVRRALVLVLRGKAEVIETAKGAIHSANRHFALPSVIRMVYYVRRPRPKLRLSRREVFARDGWACAYCGRASKDLTLDHVVPRYRGGTHSWDNLVSACKPCNHRKAGRTPAEARMRLRTRPAEPRVPIYHSYLQYLRRYQGWGKFIPGAEKARAAV
ncbi:MAG: HNH endonuclease [Chloroflexi bacterium]|nr:HNH endonuclease [Chloroflexota bacterium]MCY3603027.1 HNH endonuclease [Chloroflexota bacterium]